MSFALTDLETLQVIFNKVNIWFVCYGSWTLFPIFGFIFRLNSKLRPIISNFLLDIVITWSWVQISLLFINDIWSLSSAHSEWRTLVLINLVIVVVWTWTRNEIFLGWVSFTHNADHWGIFTKLLMCFIVTWTWNVLHFFGCHIWSLTLAKLYISYTIFHIISVRVILARTWLIFNFFYGSAEEWKRLDTCTEIFALIIILTWTHSINCLKHWVFSLRTISNCSTGYSFFWDITIWIILAWAWNQTWLLFFRSSSNRNSWYIFTKLIPIIVLARSWSQQCRLTMLKCWVIVLSYLNILNSILNNIGIWVVITWPRVHIFDRVVNLTTNLKWLNIFSEWYVVVTRSWLVQILLANHTTPTSFAYWYVFNFIFYFWNISIILTWSWILNLISS